ncbi:MAG: ABC transporter ATP-binding protein [bacterium]|nr:ABC transporter ATP-binding protein [bacterium]
MIQVEGLNKRFGDIRAVDGVSFEIRQGEIYGLLGPNGAGKTTTLSMLAGLLAPDDGRILYDGTELSVDPLGVKAKLGVVPQETAIYEELSARENLRFWAGLHDLGDVDRNTRVDEMLEQVGLSGRADERVSGYSGGMKRRLNLSMGLVHGPKFVLLDEPTVGIDPQARNNILEIVRDVAAAGTTILYTTHYLEEAEQLCNRIAIMDHGKLLAEGTLDQLKDRVGREEVVTIRGAFDADRGRKAVAGIAGIEIVGAEQGKIVLSTSGDGRGSLDVLSRVLEGKLDVDGVSIQPPSLNGLFLKLTGRELRD